MVGDHELADLEAALAGGWSPVMIHRGMISVSSTTGYIGAVVPFATAGRLTDGCAPRWRIGVFHAWRSACGWPFACSAIRCCLFRGDGVTAGAGRAAMRTATHGRVDWIADRQPDWQKGIMGGQSSPPASARPRPAMTRRRRRRRANSPRAWPRCRSCRAAAAARRARPDRRRVSAPAGR